MESSIESSQTGGISKPKPTLAPKPRLTPKPFSLQKNTTIRSIHAPRTVTATSKTSTQQTGKSEATSIPKPILTTPAQQPTTSDSKPSSVSVLTKDQPKTNKESQQSPHGEDTLDSSVGKSDPAPQTTPPKETPKSKPIQKDDIIETNHKAPADIVTNSVQKDGKKEEDETQTSVVQKPEESGGDISSTANPAYRRGSTRKRLSMELTSKFESAGLSLPPQPSVTLSTTSTKDDANKAVKEFSEPEQKQTTSEPSNRESEEDSPKDDYSGGGSIKRRISLLFDSSSRPEVITKKEEPEIINSTRGVKERIKNWAADTSSEGPKVEKKPQAVSPTRSKSSEPATPPTAEKTPRSPPVEPPATVASSSQAVDLPSKVSPAEQPTETPVETSKDGLTEVKSLENSRETSGQHIESKSSEGDVQLRNRITSTSHTATEGDSSEGAQHTLKRDNVKRRSVRFGVVESDDGGPPVILGSDSDSSEEEKEEEEKAPEDEAEEDIPVSVPVYRRLGVLQKKDDEVQRQEAERLKHLEFERKRRAEEIQQARLKLEEEQKEEEERAKERARKKEAQERERERLKVEAAERQRKEEWERERLKEEERERKRLREEEMEREKQMELVWQTQREEERERAKQKEERLKQDQEEKEKERLKEEERKEKRLREERENQHLRKEQERSVQEHEEHRLEGKLREEEMNKEKQREEEWEKEWVKKTGRLGEKEEEMEREKELEMMWQRQKEEDMERARQKEERLKQEEREKELELKWQRQKEEDMERARQKEERLKQEEREKERLREEAEERERQRRLKEQQEKEIERMRQIEMEKQREVERREEERKRQMEKERAEELERKMQEELERKRAQELEEKLRMEEERERDGLTSREGQSTVEEGNLISFDSEDAPQKTQSPYSPLAKTFEPTESPSDVVYDDFSVKQPLIQVDYDDFSVKPKRWGSQAKAETSQRWEADPVDRQEVDLLVPLDVSPLENKVPEQVEKPDSPEPTIAQESMEEEEEEQRPEETQLISMEVGEEGEERELEREEEEETKGDEEEEDTQETQVNSYCTNGKDKDTDALIDSEPDQQNEACEQPSEIDSPKPVPDHVPEFSTEDIDTTDFHTVAELAPFPESPTPLLDTSAQRSKADLGKRRIRTRPSRSLRAGLAPNKSPDWRTRDSTDEKEASFKRRESDSEEEQPKPKIVCPPPTSQRVPIFPGLSPAALIAQIKRRTGGAGTGGREEPEEDKGREEKESQNQEVAPTPLQLSRSPRSVAHLAGAALVLPPLGGTSGGAASSPAWLKELKSKKRLSQYDSEA
uniref:Tankyrase 1-binding protein C-terminal domain-containing protein n=1 Tax=Dicentrarchus labrax TaxID=13489 RepID=A0A8P4K4W7_DICLA